MQPLQAMTVAAAPPAAFRRATLVVAAVVVLIELGLFWIASRLVSVPAVDRSTHRDLIAVFIVFWTMLTLQAMGAVGVAWLLVALGRTRLTIERDRIAVEHPWRSWRGAGSDIVELYTSRGWLHLRPRGSLRTWHVRGGDRASEVLEALRALVPVDAQLSEQAARRLMVSRTLGPWLVVAAAGVLGLSLLQGWLNSLR